MTYLSAIRVLGSGAVILVGVLGNTSGVLAADQQQTRAFRGGHLTTDRTVNSSGNQQVSTVNGSFVSPTANLTGTHTVNRDLTTGQKTSSGQISGQGPHGPIDRHR